MKSTFSVQRPMTEVYCKHDQRRIDTENSKETKAADIKHHVESQKTHAAARDVANHSGEDSDLLPVNSSHWASVLLLPLWFSPLTKDRWEALPMLPELESRTL